MSKFFNINNKLYFIAILIFSFFISLNFNGQCSANTDKFSNNLLRTSLHKTASGGVAVVLATTKPYNESVRINKKSDTEYVILMPETSNSLTGKPSLKYVSDSIKNVDVKTQHYQNNIKGYTKITIHTNKPVQISTQVQTVSNINSKQADNDYKMLLSQASNKKSQRTITKEQTQKPAVKKSIKIKTVTTKKPVQKTILAGKPTKTNIKIKPQSQPQKIVKEKRKVIPNNNSQSQNLAKVAKQTQPITKTQKPTVQQNTQNKKTIKQQAQTQTQTPTPTQAQAPAKAKPQPQQPQGPSFAHQMLNSFLILFKNPSYLLGLAFVLILGLILYLREKSTNALDKSKFTKHLKDKPETTKDYAEGITDDMSWKEKFQTYMDNTQQTDKEKEAENIEDESLTTTELDELFTEDDEQTSQSQIDNQFDNQFDTTIETPQTQFFEETNLNTTKTEADFNIPTQDVNEEILNDNEFDINDISNIIEEEPTEDDNEINSNDNTSFNIEEPNEDLTTNIKEEKTFTDNIEHIKSDEMSEEIEDSVNDIKTQTTEDTAATVEPAIEIIANPPILESNTDTIQLETDNENLEENIITEDNVVTDNLDNVESEEVEEVEQNEDNIIKSEFSIDEKSGLYLVDYDDTTNLVGHINDEIFVLKRFDEKIDAPIKARLNDKSQNKSSYMTKVGSFRGVVEVTPDKMNLLIEL